MSRPHVPQPLLGEPARQLQRDDPLAHAQQHLGIVAQHRREPTSSIWSTRGSSEISAFMASLYLTPASYPPSYPLGFQQPPLADKQRRPRCFQVTHVAAYRQPPPRCRPFCRLSRLSPSQLMLPDRCFGAMQSHTQPQDWVWKPDKQTRSGVESGTKR